MRWRRCIDVSPMETTGGRHAIAPDDGKSTCQNSKGSCVGLSTLSEEQEAIPHRVEESARGALGPKSGHPVTTRIYERRPVPQPPHAIGVSLFRDRAPCVG